MINRIILLCFLTITSNTFGQTIQDIENDLSWFNSLEEYGDKIEKAKELQQIDPFNSRAIEYICRYYNDRNIDSVSIFFENLIAKFPENIEPFLLRSELLFLELDPDDRDEYYSQKVEYLKQGLNIKPKDNSIIFKLAEAYYRDFIFPLEQEKDYGFNFDFDDDLIDSTLILKKTIKRSTFKHAADSSLKYFYQTWDLSPDRREIIYFPIRQLECILKQIEKSPISKNFERTSDQCYFPSSYFTNLKEEWECDFTIDYLFEIEMGKRSAQWLEIQLGNLNESCLFNMEVQPHTTIYRFTWLRSFHHPIAIRIEKIENEVMLFWKVGKGAGGYEPEGLKKSRKKKLNEKEWAKFERLVNESNFDNLPNNNYMPIDDGATWTLERKKYDVFKAHHTNIPSKEVGEACLYLLGLTNIKVKDDDIY